MKQPEPKFHEGKTGAAITVKVISKGKKNKITEILEDGTIKICLSTGEERSKVNQALIQLLTGILEVSPTQIDIIAGQNRPEKLIAITGIDSYTAQQRILKALG